MDISKQKAICDKIWGEYNSLTEYMNEQNVYNTVKKNERFYNGKHWEGLSSKSKNSTPTMNLLQRVGRTLIATICSDDIGIMIESLNHNPDMNKNLSVISEEVHRIYENAKILESGKLSVRDGFVDGAGYMMQVFNADYETGQNSKGIIENELLDMRRVLFGNPYSNIIQKQPYIIVVLRQYVKQVQEEAKSHGCQNWEDIKGDSDDNYDEDRGQRLCTVLIKYYKKKYKVLHKRISFDVETQQPIEIIEQKEEETIFFTKVTKDAVIIPETDLGYSRYPLARFGWDSRKDSFLFDTPMTWNIENQVYINKMYGQIQDYTSTVGVPKKIVDTTKIAISDLEEDTLGVAGMDFMGKFLDYSKSPEFSNQTINAIKYIEEEMEKNMGSNDAALGNVKPENTSAIMALQEAQQVPLQIQKQNYREMNEDIVRNIIDIMCSCYHKRSFVSEEGEEITIDFDLLKGINYQLDVDTGSSQQYSEIAAVNILISLFNSGKIDLDTFVKLIPAKIIGGNKIPLLEFAKKQQELAQQVPQLPQV